MMKRGLRTNRNVETEGGAESNDPNQEVLVLDTPVLDSIVELMEHA